MSVSITSLETERPAIALSNTKAECTKLPGLLLKMWVVATTTHPSTFPAERLGNEGSIYLVRGDHALTGYRRTNACDLAEGVPSQLSSPRSKTTDGPRNRGRDRPSY